MVLQDAEPGDIDLEDALKLLAEKQRTQDKKDSKARAVKLKRQAVALSNKAVSSSNGEGATSDDKVQPSSSSSSTSSSEALDAGGETIAAGGSSVKEKVKRKYVRANSSGRASANGTTASGGTSDVKERSKGRSRTVNEEQGKGKSDAAAAPTPKKGYRAFWSQMWAKLKVDDPGIKMTGASKQIASVWKDMDAESKAQYN